MERRLTARRISQKSGSGCAIACTPSRARICHLSQGEVPGWKIVSDEQFHADVGPRIGFWDTVLNSPTDTMTLKESTPNSVRVGDGSRWPSGPRTRLLAWVEVRRMSTEE